MKTRHVRSSTVQRLKNRVSVLSMRVTELELAMGAAQRDICEIRTHDAVCHTEGSQARDYRDIGIELAEEVAC